MFLPCPDHSGLSEVQPSPLKVSFGGYIGRAHYAVSDEAAEKKVETDVRVPPTGVGPAVSKAWLSLIIAREAGTKGV